MATVKQIVGAPSSLTVTGLSTLASANYAVSNAVNNTTDQPVDLLLEASIATTNTPTGNKQVVVFAQASFDGTNWQSGPTTGSTTTDEPDLTYVGLIPMNTASTTHRKQFSIAQVFGFVPAYVRFVFKNDLGVALTSASVQTSEVSATVA